MKQIQFLIFLWASISFSANAATWNDVSRLNPQKVSDVVKVGTTEDILNVLEDLPNDTKIVISGTRHSQGGHIVYPNALVLDMSNFNKVLSLSPKDKSIVVQSGATWALVQEAANKYGLSVKVMQSSNIFSIGGSLSANVHGRDPRFGPIIETVRSIKVLLANGQIVTASRSKNPELFYGAIGGYGLLGVILEAEIELTDNLPLVKTTSKVLVANYAKEVENQADELALHYGRCSFAPGDTFLKECYSTNFKDSGNKNTISELEPEKNIKRNSLVFGASRKSDLGKSARWKLQKELIDKPGKGKNIDRNPAMQPPVKFLTYDNPKDTDILQEYFVPTSNFQKFFEDLRHVLQYNEVNLLSVTLRYLRENRESYLSYATSNMVAVVIYVNIDLDETSIEKAGMWTRKLVDLSLKNNGTYYLTYQGFPTLKQFQLAYPNWEKFMAVKCIYDPDETFTSMFYEQYLKAAYIETNKPKSRNDSKIVCR